MFVFASLQCRPCHCEIWNSVYFLTVQFAEVEIFPKVVCKFRSSLVEREVCYSLSLTEISGTSRRYEEQGNLTSPHYTKKSTSDDTQTFYHVRFSLTQSGVL
jgi:hypothetical protein